MTTTAETTVLLTPRQVAERVGLSLSTLSKMRLATAGTGAIPYLKLGPKSGAVRYDADDVQSWLAAQPRHRASFRAGRADTSPWVTWVTPPFDVPPSSSSV